MSTFMHSKHDSEDFGIELTDTHKKNISQKYTEVSNNEGYLENLKEENETTKPFACDNIPEDFNTQTGVIPEKFVSVKPPIKVPSEVSPFKQAVKGFVINKLSKKVGSSHILYGLTEKIVKKLEEGKDSSIGVTQDERKTQAPLLESSPKNNLEPLPCELRPVLESSFPHSSSVEEAIECFEELQSLVVNGDSNSKELYKTKVFSKSLPCSPLNQLNPDIFSNIDDFSDFEERNLFAERAKVSSKPSKFFQNVETETPTKQTNEIELQTINTSEKEAPRRDISISNSLVDTYPENAYNFDSGKNKKPDKKKKCINAFQSFKSAFASLPLPHIFLLTTIIVHNLKFLSTVYFDYLFDSFMLAYVIYILLDIWMKTKDETVPESLAFQNDHFETTSIDLSDFNKTLKGSVKILKGEYDPEALDKYDTESVNIRIANHCLKISRPSLKDDDGNVNTPTEVYDLCGAGVSLVPHTLKKKRLFLCKYPICITLPLAAKKWEDSSGSFDDMVQEEKTDFISLVEHEDGLAERPKHKALYIFALTNREKEAWFHALTKCLKKCDSDFIQNIPVVTASPKMNFSSLSYSSLMENEDESLTIIEDDSGSNPEIVMSPIEKELYMDFDDYMKLLWENYQKVIQLSSPSEESVCTAKKMEGEFKGSCCVEWLNVAVGRLLYDFLTQKKWSDVVLVRIQKKLDKIEMPNFVETLQVTDVFMGNNLPQLHAVSNPSIDNFGIWFDFDFTYPGSFYMTLKIKLKIPKERQFKGSDETEPENNKLNTDGSDASDEDGSGSKRSPNKFINKIEKWMTYKHFQTVAQSQFVKKYVGDISNMPLTLTVEVNKLQGILSLNIPPAPTDRIWFGFHKDPILSITATPKVGSKEINLSAIVQMIERKLVQAFKKALVMPHMDDLVIPIMFSPLREDE